MDRNLLNEEHELEEFIEDWYWDEFPRAPMR